MKQRKCAQCRVFFLPKRIGARVCSIQCAIELGQKIREKKARAENRAIREKLKSRADRIKEAQAAFNKYIRLRDKDDPCISCGRHHEGQYHAGHYLSTGARPELRFCEANVHKQCMPCNTHLSGNIAMYRKALIVKIGQQMVDYLEGPHEPKKYTVGELIEIKEKYRQKLKEYA